MGRLNLLIVLCTLACSIAQAEDHDIAYNLLQKGEILPLEKILQINNKTMPGKVLEVELERENKRLIYEIEVLNEQGVVWEYKINAKTGKIIKKELD
jgi:uncharacterized membrane protein YkoI